MAKKPGNWFSIFLSNRTKDLLKRLHPKMALPEAFQAWLLVTISVGQELCQSAPAARGNLFSSKEIFQLSK